jgi:long-chain acyl-CoA synthetase
MTADEQNHATHAETFAHLLHDHADRRGGAVVIREKRRGIWQSITWRELSDQAGALAASFGVLRLGTKDHIALVGDNRPGLFIAMAAAHQVGAVVVPLFSNATDDEIALQIDACTAKIVFAENQEQVDKLLRILPRCPSVKAIIYDDDRGMRHYTQPTLFARKKLVDEGRKLAVAPAPQSGADAAFVFFTSATSGAAKGVVFSHTAMIGAARRLSAADGLGASDVTLAVLPPGWMCQTLFTYGLAMVAGQCICCPESPATLMEDMREIAPTTLLSTPRMLDAILSRMTFQMEDTGGLANSLYKRALARGMQGWAGGTGVAASQGWFGNMFLNLVMAGPLRDTLGMSRIKAAYSTGDTLDPAMLGAFRGLGINLKQLYGTTETAFTVAVQRSGAVRPDTVGTLFDGVEVSISDDREIMVRSPFQMSGILGAVMADASAAPEWIATGDAGFLDADGQLHVLGRLDSLGQMAGGAVFTPRALEGRIRVSPYIREAVAIGDGRDAVCALIDIDTLAVGKWADGHEIPYSGHVDLASQEKVYALVAGWISEVNEALAADPALAPMQIRRFVLLPRELSAEDGLLTRTGKLRRAEVMTHFAALIDALHSGSDEAAFETAADTDHGAEAANSVGLKIRDARVIGDDRRAA